MPIYASKTETNNPTSTWYEVEQLITHMVKIGRTHHPHGSEWKLILWHNWWNIFCHDLWHLFPAMKSWVEEYVTNVFLNMPSCREGREESPGETPRRTEAVHAVTHEHAQTGHLPTRTDALHALHAPSSPVSPFLTGVARTRHPPHQQICAVRSHVIKHISLSYSQQHISGIL